MSRLRVAIQKSGRLSERSQEVLKSCGLKFARSKDKLFWYGQDFPVDLLLVRDDDIPAPAARRGVRTRHRRREHRHGSHARARMACLN